MQADASTARDTFGKMSKKAKSVIKDNNIKVGYFDDNRKYVEVDDIDNI